MISRYFWLPLHVLFKDVLLDLKDIRHHILQLGRPHVGKPVRTSRGCACSTACGLYWDYGLTSDFCWVQAGLGRDAWCDAICLF